MALSERIASALREVDELSGNDHVYAVAVPQSEGDYPLAVYQILGGERIGSFEGTHALPVVRVGITSPEYDDALKIDRKVRRALSSMLAEDPGPPVTFSEVSPDVYQVNTTYVLQGTV